MPQNETTKALLKLIVDFGGSGVFGGFHQAVSADIYFAGN